MNAHNSFFISIIFNTQHYTQRADQFSTILAPKNNFQIYIENPKSVSGNRVSAVIVRFCGGGAGESHPHAPIDRLPIWPVRLRALNSTLHLSANTL